MSILASLKTTKFWLKFALVGILTASLWYVANDYIETKKELAVAISVNKDNAEEFANIKESIEDGKKRVKELNDSVSGIKGNYYSAIRKLNILEGKIAQFKDDPETGKERVQRSVDKYMKDMSCITGDNSQCE